MAGQTAFDLDRPRSITQMIGATFTLYLRVPILFLVLAAIVVVPYELIVLAISGAGPFAQGQLGFIASKGLLAADSFLITPLISALHVHAVREVGDGGRPNFTTTVRQSLPTLPVVAVAAGISGIAISIGFLAFVIPGMLLSAIWPVVAQTAALEPGSPIEALRRSADLTRGYRWHALGLVLVAGLIASVPWLPLWSVIGHTTTTVASFVVGTALQVLLRSFTALVTAVLYFDLTARLREGAHDAQATGLSAPAASTDKPGDPLAPHAYSDEDRPPGWYIDPKTPRRMRYWAPDGKQGWSEYSAKTPGQTLAEWHDLNKDPEEGV